MKELYSSLLQLQELDQEIEKSKAGVAAFAPRLAEVREPVVALQRDQEQMQAQLETLRKQQAKLSHGLNNKRERLRIAEERVAKARNARDEAATRTEMDFIKRAVEAEEVEANEVNDQVRRSDMKLDELDKALEKVRADIAPKEQEIEAERDQAKADLKVLQDKRANQALHMDKQAVRLYDNVRAGKRKTALAPLTDDGACGICYNVLPMQEQSEIRSGGSLRRCEACGVILYPV